MKSTICATSAVLCMAAGLALAAEPLPPIEQKPAMMLYLKKSFGADDRREAPPLSFGLRLEEQTLHGGKSAPLFDLRHHAGLGTVFFAGGTPTWVSKSLAEHPRFGFDSWSAENSWQNPWFYVGLGLVVVGGLCIAEEVICEDDDEYTPPPTETPGEG